MRPGSRYIVAAALALGFAGGCQPKLTRRHRLPREGVPVEETQQNLTDLGITLLPVAPSITSKSIFDLSDSGQTALIGVLAAGQDGPTTMRLMRGDLTPEASSSTTVDRSGGKWRIVVSLEHDRWDAPGIYSPADRVMLQRVAITIPQGVNYTFTGYDKVDTGFGVANLGTLSRSANWSATGTLSGSAGRTKATASRAENPGAIASSTENSRALALGVDGSLSVSGGETLDEAVTLTSRFIDLSVWLSEDRKTLNLVREGAPGIDLTGNAWIDVTIADESPTSRQLFVLALPSPPRLVVDPPTSASAKAETKVAPVPPGPKLGSALEILENSTIERTTLTVARSLKFEVAATQETLVRHVGRGSRTVSEHDDRISIQHPPMDTVGAQRTVAPTIVHGVSVMCTAKNGSALTSPLVVARADTGREEEAIFALLDDAELVAQALALRQTVAVGPFTFQPAAGVGFDEVTDCSFAVSDQAVAL